MLSSIVFRIKLWKSENSFEISENSVYEIKQFMSRAKRFMGKNVKCFMMNEQNALRILWATTKCIGRFYLWIWHISNKWMEKKFMTFKCIPDLFVPPLLKQNRQLTKGWEIHEKLMTTLMYLQNAKYQLILSNMKNLEQLIF